MAMGKYRKPKPQTMLVAVLMIAACSTCDGFLQIPRTARMKATWTNAWHGPSTSSTSSSTSLYYNQDDTYGELFDADVLAARIQQMKVDIMEEEMRRPPNPSLTPEQVIREVMDGLLNSDDPLPDAGFRCLFRASTKEWRSKILHSIGAKENANLDVAASALGAAIGRPHNQFAILVGEEENYRLDFTSDPVDYQDGNCWVECKLRGKENDKLLVITGWEMHQREDGAWLIDGMDWQDFRDEYRPGIGREEWMRVCG